MKLSALNPHIRYAQFHDTPLKPHKEPSICYDCRLFFFENTSGNISINNENYNIANQTAIFLPPETEYKLNIIFGDKPSFIVFNFDLTTAHESIINSMGTPTKSKFDKNLVPEYELPQELMRPYVVNIGHIKPMLTQCVNSFIIKNAFYRENASALLKLSILEILKDTSKASHSKLCKDVLSYIRDNYNISNLTNESIAAKFNYHPYHLSKIIKEETGKTLHQFLIYYRLRLARDLLITTQYNVSEIAWKCGFGTAAYFTKIFRQNMDVTPKEYRKQNEYAKM